MANCQRRGYYGRFPAIRLKEKQKGVVVVEFALLLPLLVLILFGIVETGVVLYDKAIITNASREGARAGVVLVNPALTASQMQTQVQNVVTNYAFNYLLSFTQQNTPLASIAPLPASAPTNSAGQQVYTFGQPVSVTVTYQYSGLGLGKVLSVFTGPIVLSATTVMNHE